MKLDFSKFKHVSSDGKTTTLQHPAGHTITLTHKALSPDNQKALAALSPISKQDETPLEQDQIKHKMASGGKIIVKEDKPQELGKVSVIPEKEQPIGRVTVKDKKESAYDPKFWENHKRQKMAEGGPPYTDFQPPMTQNPDIQQPQQPTEVQPASSEKPKDSSDLVAKKAIYNNIVQSLLPSSEGQRLQWGANGEEPQGGFKPHIWDAAESHYKNNQEYNKAEEAEKIQDLQKLNQSRLSAGLPAMPVPGDQPAAQSSTVPGDMPEQPSPRQQAAQSTMGKDPFLAGQGALEGGLNQALAGLKAGAKAEGALGEERAKQLDASINSQQAAQASFKDKYNKLDSERQAHIQDMENGHIDPEKYWDSHSKIATGIGMILAGFNPTTNPNAAINFLKFQMEQNLQAQGKNLESKNNLLKANLEQFHNLRDSTEMTRIMQNDALAHQLDKAAAKAATPMAAANAQKAAGQLRIETAPMLQQFAMRKATIDAMQEMNGQQNPGQVDHMLGMMRVVNPEMAKEMESRYAPGVGVASVPLTPEVRGQLEAKENLHNAASDLLNYVKTHTNMNPMSAEYKKGEAMAFNLKQLYRQGQLGGILRQGEMPLLDKILEANPANVFKTINSVPKLEEMINLNNNSANTLKSTVGLPQRHLQAAPQYKIKDGIKYMRGPNGEAIPVK
jgi:hypothetical protein